MSDYDTLFREDLSPGEWALSIALFVTLVVTNLYALSKTFNLLRALIATKCFTTKPIEGGKVEQGNEPVVTIQICAYNEASVIEDTINAACNVDWPKDKLHVQVCDDSTDETTDIIQAACVKWQEKGVNCQLLRRSDRVGYKAGSLHCHTKSVKGDFVALFDSDHRAEPSFLRRAIPQFFNGDGSPKTEIGLVQLPWAFYNTHQNMLTEYDALFSDISHVVEQTGRAAALKCFGFNGTGGVWRRDAVVAGGGWQWDTVTEDLDLSYLAHLQGYDFVYLRDLPQQLELPSGIRAHVQQKHRWTKGFLQVLRKSLWNILTSKRSSFAVKYEALFHFSGNVGYTLALLVFMLSAPAIYLDLFTVPLAWIGAFPIFVVTACTFVTIYGKVSGSNGHYKSFVSRTLRAMFVFPVGVMIGLGMCVFETYAIIDGLTSNDATFKRTPKEGSSMFVANGSNSVPMRPSHSHTSVLDFVKEEEEDDDGDEPVQMVSISPKEQSIPKLVMDEMSKTKAKGKKRAFFGLVPEKYFKDVLLGLAGLILAAYLIIWYVFILFNPTNDSPITFFVLAPVPGLIYIHGSFCLALLQPALVKKWEAWNHRRKQGKHAGALEQKQICSAKVVADEPPTMRHNDSKATLDTMWSSDKSSSEEESSSSSANEDGVVTDSGRAAE